MTTAVAAPHLIRLERVSPMWAAAVWLATLALRATLAIAGAIFLFVHFPQGELGISEHPIAHAAGLLPAAVLAGSVMWLLFAVTRSRLALARLLSGTIGEGPAGSTIVHDSGLLVAATRLGRPRVVVSDAALDAMDPDEVRASLAHEIGHLHRWHRPILLAASVLAAVGRVLPGTQAVRHELQFQLERDADEFAVSRTSDPLALATH